MALAALGSGPKLCRCADVVEVATAATAALPAATARSKAEKPRSNAESRVVFDHQTNDLGEL